MHQHVLHLHHCVLDEEEAFVEDRSKDAEYARFKRYPNVLKVVNANFALHWWPSPSKVYYSIAIA